MTAVAEGPADPPTSQELLVRHMTWRELVGSGSSLKLKGDRKFFDGFFADHPDDMADPLRFCIRRGRVLVTQNIFAALYFAIIHRQIKTNQLDSTLRTQLQELLSHHVGILDPVNQTRLLQLPGDFFLAKPQAYHCLLSQHCEQLSEGNQVRLLELPHPSIENREEAIDSLLLRSGYDKLSDRSKGLIRPSTRCEYYHRLIFGGEA